MREPSKTLVHTSGKVSVANGPCKAEGWLSRSKSAGTSRDMDMASIWMVLVCSAEGGSRSCNDISFCHSLGSKLFNPMSFGIWQSFALRSRATMLNVLDQQSFATIRPHCSNVILLHHVDHKLRGVHHVDMTVPNVGNSAK